MKSLRITLTAAALSAMTGSYASQVCGSATESRSLPSDSVVKKTVVADKTVKNTSDTIIGATYGDLDELVVTANKKIVQSDGAKLTYNLSEDNTTKGQTMLDALKKVPMVTVDGQDNIMINGDSNFKIYVNGKEEPMLQANASKIFKSMPAEAFQKIEVITEPGAKFDAEGTGGILNLITEQKQNKDGYTGTLSASFNNQMWGASAFGRVKTGKFTADANVNYANNGIWGQDQRSCEEQINHFSDDNHRQVTTGSQKVKFHYTDVNLNASCEFDDRNLFTFGGSYMDMNGRINSMTRNTAGYDRNGNRSFEFNQNLRGFLHNNSASANASYQHSFDNKGHRLNIAYLFNFGKSPLHAWSENTGVFNYEFPLPYSTTLTDSYNREHTVQLDYANPFGGDKHLLETGYKMILRHNTNTSSTLSGKNETEQIVTDEVDMLQKQNIFAAYASYTGNYGNIGVKAGVRYEHTDMGIDFRKGENEDFDKTLDDVVPNAALTYMFSPASNLRLAYQMRISRPSLNQVNPYRLSIMETEVMTGNPDLESERNNKISLTYTNFSRIAGGNIGIEYSQTDNAITSYNYWIDNVTYQSYANIGHNRRFSFFGFFNWNITSKMTFSVNGRATYVSLKSKSPDYTNHGWQGNYGANWAYTAPGDLKLSVYGGQMIHRIMLQGHSSGYNYYGLGISRDFLKEKNLTVTVNASNFFTKYTSYKSYIKTEKYSVNTDWRNRNWTVGINLSWRFGHLKSQTKKTALQIQNDDKSMPEEKGGGGLGL